ncbi:ATP-binding cassette domain-containing protein [Streptomyces sp. NPDC020983]|uniref:ATP-binding cassette domain-containing protein n=1 Tax=Streptomyces sp. NPDC020983 TaxID=3365106 RepID=UPI00378E3A10
MAEPLLEARLPTTRFGHVTALGDADFTACPGGRRLIGDSGAGRSSLVKVLSGAPVTDSGEILVEGRPVRRGSPLDARRHGAETVFQGLAPAPGPGARPRQCGPPDGTGHGGRRAPCHHRRTSRPAQRRGGP